MARITSEDCIDKVSSRFELVMLAAQRAKALASGTPAMMVKSDDKDPVLALREIAAGLIDIDALRESAIKKRNPFYASAVEDTPDTEKERVEESFATAAAEANFAEEEEIEDETTPLVTNMYASESYDDIEIEEDSPQKNLSKRGDEDEEDDYNEEDDSYDEEDSEEEEENYEEDEEDDR